MRVWAKVDTALGPAALRSLEPADVDAVVRFWHESGDELLDFLGIDRGRLGTPDDTRQRFLRAIPSGDPEQANLAFAIAVAGELSGYTLLNRYSPAVNYSHWHIIRPELRGAGLSSTLYPYRIRMYFEAAPMERLTHQTRTRNIAVNRMLDKWVPIAETRYIDDPDGVALPGEFHLRYVRREDVPALFEKAHRPQGPLRAPD
jgi:hypothetical protein